MSRLDWEINMFIDVESWHELCLIRSALQNSKAPCRNDDGIGERGAER